MKPNAKLFSELVVEVFRLNRQFLDAGDELVQPVGLSSARWQVLGVLEQGPISAAHVSRLMGLTRQGVQRTADSLEADGFLVYQPNPHHRRAQLLTLTPKGRAALAEVWPRQAKWAAQLSENLSLEELQTTLDLLRHIQTNLTTKEIL